MNSSQWPPALRDFVERVFVNCRSSAERTKAQEWLRAEIARVTESGSLWTANWGSYAVPNFTDSSTVVTCPMCGNAFAPCKQNLTVLNAQRYKVGLPPIEPPRRWQDIVSLELGPSGEMRIRVYTPEAVAGRWAQQFGGIQWGDFVHEQCLDTMAAKAKEFQDVSNLAFPEIMQHKWRELQKWAKHVNALAEEELKKLLAEGQELSRKRQKNVNSHLHTDNRKNRANANQSFNPPQRQHVTTTSCNDESNEDDLRKSLRKDRFGNGGLLSGETSAFIKQEKRKQKLQVKRARQSQWENKGHRARDVLGDDPVVGICELMCPLAELEKRLRTNDFDELEQPNSKVPELKNLGVHNLAVKRFARTITEEDRQPDRLRTRSALKKTMLHLLSLMDSKRATFEKVHRFLWDRYRAVRTDLSIQHIKDDFAVGCLEEMIRFHIIAEHELCEETATVTNPHGFNSHLNVEQLYKCLTSLFSLYDELAKSGKPCANEPEFRAFQILLTMDTHGKYRRDSSAHCFALSKMRPEVLHSDFVQFAVKLNSLYHGGNFVKFFGIVRKSPFVVSCILHAYFNPLRTKAVRLFSAGVFGKNATLPVSYVKESLLLDTEREAMALLRGFGLEVKRDQSGETVVRVGAKNFVEPKEDVPRKRSAFISALRAKGSQLSSFVSSPVSVHLAP